MDVFVRFLSDFLATFFGNLWKGISGMFIGLFGMFNVKRYIEVFKAYASDFGALQWILAILVVLLLVAALAAIAFVIYLLIRKYVRIRTTFVSQEELLNEVGNLNREIVKLTTEKERILAMKVSQIGLKPGESAELDEVEE
ncbi:MAG: hypothetical protein IKU10_05640, partial [Clostridia bacterium]|nr:hypothetical protein [Clostridia bacterium]